MKQVEALNLYDYGARWYDPAICRFTGIDPLSHKFAHLSTYNYAENQPISKIDLWGLQAVLAKDGSIIGYRVQKGQGPTQIAKDLNDNYCNKLSGSIIWTNIVFSNPDKFTNENRNDVYFRYTS